jgi:hypothetical protein
MVMKTGGKKNSINQFQVKQNTHTKKLFTCTSEDHSISEVCKDSNKYSIKCSHMTNTLLS